MSGRQRFTTNAGMKHPWHRHNVGCIVYADDVVLLSASVRHLQKMLDICSDQAADIDIVFNAKKSSLPWVNCSIT